MNKDEYLKRLKSRLNQLNIEGKDEVMNDFINHFELGHQAGLSDEELMLSLGSIDEILESFECMNKHNQATIQIDGHAQKKEFNDKIKTLTISARHADTKISESSDGRIHVDLYKEGKLLDRLSHSLTAYQQDSEYFITVLPIFPYKNTGIYELTLQVPSDLELITLRTSSGDIVGDSLHVKRFNVLTASGSIEFSKIVCTSAKFDVSSSDIVIHEINGNLDINCVSGDLTIKQSHGQTLVYKGISGDFNLVGDYESIKLTQVSGDIKAQFKTIQQMDVTSTSGDINISIANQDNLRIASNTLSGDCEITLNHKNLNLEHNCSFQLGQADCLISLNTTSGDIHLDME